MAKRTLQHFAPDSIKSYGIYNTYKSNNLIDNITDYEVFCHWEHKEADLAAVRITNS